MKDEQARALRSLPAVSTILTDPRVLASDGSIAREVVADITREALDAAREAILTGRTEAGTTIVDRVLTSIGQLLQRSPTRVINGTGVVIQTNLGRSPVSRETGAAMRDAAEGYVALETDLESGERGGRGRTIDAQMRALTGAERTLVVNNNAAAVFLTLSALCAGKDVIVSRGESVEIGGGFRIPDVLKQSGANLVEVGTTNRTYASDYGYAVTPDTAAFLKVHASNFAMIGFTSSPAIDELTRLARDRSVLFLEDAGSGCLLDTTRFGLQREPTLAESLGAGVDVVCASGDKLLGGPQAGLILGRKDLVGRIAKHPLARALRSDKTCLAGVSATLTHYIRGDAVEAIPVWWSISRPVDWLNNRVQSWASLLGSVASVVETQAVVGGGSLPGSTLASRGIAVGGHHDAASLSTRLRTGTIPIVPRIIDDRVVIDARTVLKNEDALMLDAIRQALA